MKNLSTLNLSRTRVTDAGLAQLQELSHLKIVYLYDTKVTAAAVDQLKRAIPGVQVQGVQPAGNFR